MRTSSMIPVKFDPQKLPIMRSYASVDPMPYDHGFVLANNPLVYPLNAVPSYVTTVNFHPVPRMSLAPNVLSRSNPCVDPSPPSNRPFMPWIVKPGLGP